MKNTPILTTARLLLRPMTKEDLPTVFAYAGNPQNTEYMLFLPYETVSEAEKELAKIEEKMSLSPQHDFFFAIEKNGIHIGEISLEMNEAMTEAELGWILHRDHWGKGYMKEAALAVCGFAKTFPTLKLLYAHCDTRNKASSSVMEYLGMRLSEKGIRKNRNSTTPSEDSRYILKFE